MKTILVVEDEVSIADMVKLILESEGYQVQTASDGKDGLTMVEKIQPDLVLCDVMMPNMDGRKMIRAMQANPTYQSVPVVMMSAVGESAVKGQCNYAAFLAKPFDVDDLVDTVIQLVGSSDAA